MTDQNSKGDSKVEWFDLSEYGASLHQLQWGQNSSQVVPVLVIADKKKYISQNPTPLNQKALKTNKSGFAQLNANKKGRAITTELLFLQCKYSDHPDELKYGLKSSLQKLLQVDEEKINSLIKPIAIKDIVVKQTFGDFEKLERIKERANTLFGNILCYKVKSENQPFQDFPTFLENLEKTQHPHLNSDSLRTAIPAEFLDQLHISNQNTSKVFLTIDDATRANFKVDDLEPSKLNDALPISLNSDGSMVVLNNATSLGAMAYTDFGWASNYNASKEYVTAQRFSSLMQDLNHLSKTSQNYSVDETLKKVSEGLTFIDQNLFSTRNQKTFIPEITPPENYSRLTEKGLVVDKTNQGNWHYVEVKASGGKVIDEPLTSERLKDVLNLFNYVNDQVSNLLPTNIDKKDISPNISNANIDKICNRLVNSELSNFSNDQKAPIAHVRSELKQNIQGSSLNKGTLEAHLLKTQQNEEALNSSDFSSLISSFGQPIEKSSLATTQNTIEDKVNIQYSNQTNLIKPGIAEYKDIHEAVFSKNEINDDATKQDLNTLYHALQFLQFMKIQPLAEHYENFEKEASTIKQDATDFNKTFLNDIKEKEKLEKDLCLEQVKFNVLEYQIKAALPNMSHFGCLHLNADPNSSLYRISSQEHYEVQTKLLKAELLRYQRKLQPTENILEIDADLEAHCKKNFNLEKSGSKFTHNTTQFLPPVTKIELSSDLGQSQVYENAFKQNLSLTLNNMMVQNFSTNISNLKDLELRVDNSLKDINESIEKQNNQFMVKLKFDNEEINNVLSNSKLSATSGLTSNNSLKQKIDSLAQLSIFSGQEHSQDILKIYNDLEKLKFSSDPSNENQLATKFLLNQDLHAAPLEGQQILKGWGMKTQGDQSFVIQAIDLNSSYESTNIQPLVASEHKNALTEAFKEYKFRQSLTELGFLHSEIENVYKLADALLTRNEKDVSASSVKIFNESYTSEQLQSMKFDYSDQGSSQVKLTVKDLSGTNTVNKNLDLNEAKTLENQLAATYAIASHRLNNSSSQSPVFDNNLSKGIVESYQNLYKVPQAFYEIRDQLFPNKKNQTAYQIDSKYIGTRETTISADAYNNLSSKVKPIISNFVSELKPQEKLEQGILLLKLAESADSMNHLLVLPESYLKGMNQLTLKQLGFQNERIGALHIAPDQLSHTVQKLVDLGDGYQIGKSSPALPLSRFNNNGFFQKKEKDLNMEQKGILEDGGAVSLGRIDYTKVVETSINYAISQSPTKVLNDIFDGVADYNVNILMEKVNNSEKFPKLLFQPDSMPIPKQYNCIATADIDTLNEDIRLSHYTTENGTQVFKPSNIEDVVSLNFQNQYVNQFLKLNGFDESKYIQHRNDIDEKNNQAPENLAFQGNIQTILSTTRDPETVLAKLESVYLERINDLVKQEFKSGSPTLGLTFESTAQQFPNFTISSERGAIALPVIQNQLKNDDILTQPEIQYAWNSPQISLNTLPIISVPKDEINGVTLQAVSDLIEKQTKLPYSELTKENARLYVANNGDDILFSLSTTPNKSNALMNQGFHPDINSPQQKGLLFAQDPQGLVKQMTSYLSLPHLNNDEITAISKTKILSINDVQIPSVSKLKQSPHLQETMHLHAKLDAESLNNLPHYERVDRTKLINLWKPSDLENSMQSSKSQLLNKQTYNSLPKNIFESNEPTLSQQQSYIDLVFDLKKLSKETLPIKSLAEKILVRLNQDGNIPLSEKLNDFKDHLKTTISRKADSPDQNISEQITQKLLNGKFSDSYNHLANKQSIKEDSPTPQMTSVDLEQKWGVKVVGQIFEKQLKQIDQAFSNIADNNKAVKNKEFVKIILPTITFSNENKTGALFLKHGNDVEIQRQLVRGISNGIMVATTNHEIQAQKENNKNGDYMALGLMALQTKNPELNLITPAAKAYTQVAEVIASEKHSPISYTSTISAKIEAQADVPFLELKGLIQNQTSETSNLESVYANHFLEKYKETQQQVNDKIKKLDISSLSDIEYSSSVKEIINKACDHVNLPTKFDAPVHAKEFLGGINSSKDDPQVDSVQFLTEKIVQKSPILSQAQDVAIAKIQAIGLKTAFEHAVNLSPEEHIKTASALLDIVEEKFPDIQISKINLSSDQGVVTEIAKSLNGLNMDTTTQQLISEITSTLSPKDQDSQQVEFDQELQLQSNPTISM